MKKKLKPKLNSTNVINVLVFAFLFAYPLFSSSYKTNNMVFFLIQIILAMSLVLIWGLCGLFSFGQAAFFGIGGYAYGIIALNIGNTAFTPLAMICTLAIGFAVAGILGYFLFYGGVNDSFLGVITMCFTLACNTFMAQTSGDMWKIGSVRLGGYNGINRIPTLFLGDVKISNTSLYYLVLLLILGFIIAYNYIKKRPTGYALIGLRENTPRSSLFGYNAAKIKTLTFALGGMVAALSGVLYAMWGGYVVPTSMGMAQSTTPVILAAAGGRKNPTAVLLFSLLYLQFSQSLAAQGSQYAYIILGVLLIVVIIFVPNGLVQGLFGFLDQKLFGIRPDDVSVGGDEV